MALVIWVVAALWITVLNRVPGVVYTPELIPFHSYRKLIATGIDEILRANFMNVALFYPAGLLAASLLPECWGRRRLILFVGILFALFSLGIEYTQFAGALGEPEMDDVIHNTLGSIFGTFPIVFRDVLHDPDK